MKDFVCIKLPLSKLSVEDRFSHYLLANLNSFYGFDVEDDCTLPACCYDDEDAIDQAPEDWEDSSIWAEIMNSEI